MAFVSLKSQKVHHRIVPLNISVADSPYALSSPQIPIPYPKNEKAPADAEAKNMVGEEGSDAAGLPDPDTFLTPNTNPQTQTHIPETKKPQQTLRLKIWSVKRDPARLGFQTPTRSSSQIPKTKHKPISQKRKSPSRC